MTSVTERSQGRQGECLIRAEGTLEKKEKGKRLWRALVPGREVRYKHPRSSFDANTNLIPATSDVFAFWEIWFF